MGEYALYNGEQIKIGTCESMYYLRWDQRHNVIPLPGNVDPIKDVESIWFRIPKRDELNIEPGAFEYNGFCGAKPLQIAINKNNKKLIEELKEIAIKSPGIYHLRAEKIGVTANIPCCHGFTTELPKGMHYNGFNPNVLGIEAVGYRDGEAYARIACTACGHTFAKVPLSELDNEENFYPFGDHAENWALVIDTMYEIQKEMNGKAKSPKR